MFHRFANPARFTRLAGALLPWVGTVTVLLVPFWYGFGKPPALFCQVTSATPPIGPKPVPVIVKGSGTAAANSAGAVEPE